MIRPLFHSQAIYYDVLHVVRRSVEFTPYPFYTDLIFTKPVPTLVQFSSLNFIFSFPEAGETEGFQFPTVQGSWLAWEYGGDLG